MGLYSPLPLGAALGTLLGAVVQTPAEAQSQVKIHVTVLTCIIPLTAPANLIDAFGL